MGLKLIIYKLDKCWEFGRLAVLLKVGSNLIICKVDMGFRIGSCGGVQVHLGHLLGGISWSGLRQGWNIPGKPAALQDLMLFYVG